MKNLLEPDVQKYRLVAKELFVIGQLGGKDEGVFEIPSEQSFGLMVIASSGKGWDHVSVSLPHRCPTWDEMEKVRNIFGHAHEVWVQFGVPQKYHISYHPYCLHWWRDQHRGHRLPPSWMVGPS